jgi:serine/threonine protein kinase
MHSSSYYCLFLLAAMGLPSNTYVHPTGHTLGQGAYSDVMEVEHQGKTYAAKKYRRKTLSRIGGLDKECKLLTRISHPNIVSYFGVAKLTTKDKSSVIVMEKMDIELSKYIGGAPIRLERKTQILDDVVKGLHHLHSQIPAIIHRDLTASNVMLDSNGTAKICDFGNSRMVDLLALPELLTSNPGTLDYMPPEAGDRNYNDKLDVFSFGHLSIYVILQRHPHELQRKCPKIQGKYVIRTEVERRQHFLDEVKSTLEGGNNHPLYQLIIKCLQDEPEMRPSCADILKHSTFAQLNT